MAQDHHQLILEKIGAALNVSPLDIDIHSSFVRLGGHSLSAIQLVAACKDHGYQLSIKVILTSPSIHALLEYAQSQPKEWNVPPQVGTEVAAGGTKRRTFSISIPLEECMIKDGRDGEPPNDQPSQDTVQFCETDNFPMTEMQLSLVHGSIKRSGTNLIRYFETYHSKDISRMKRAWRSVIHSEPIFRTKFVITDDDGSLREEPLTRFCWTETTCESIEAYQRCLQDPPPETETIGTWFEVYTVCGDSRIDSRSTIVWNVHHALVDEYSFVILLRKVQEHLRGISCSPGPSFGQIAGQLKKFQDQHAAQGRDFWTRQSEIYNNPASLLRLGSSSSTQHRALSRMAILEFQFDHRVLDHFARIMGVTFSSVFHAIWGLVLSRYLESDSLSFGAVLSGRNLPFSGVDRVIGPLINTLPFAVCIDRASSIRKYLQEVFTRLVELTDHQWTSPQHGFKREFSTALSVQMLDLEDDDRALVPIEEPYYQLATDIPMSVTVLANGYVHIRYDEREYHEKYVAALGCVFENALSKVVHHHGTVGSFLESILPQTQIQKTLEDGNAFSISTFNDSIDMDLVDLFNRAVLQQPKAIAIEKGNSCVSYSELNSKASCVAAFLSSLALENEVICINADRSLDWIIGIYGILKANCVYCPLDETLPEDLRNSNFVTARASIFLTSLTANKARKPASCEQCFSIEEILANAGSKTSRALPVSLAQTAQEYSTNIRTHPLLRKSNPAANAYLCFTSGSTGKPKGVVCTHRSLVAFQKDHVVRLGAEHGMRIAQTMSAAFDGSIHEIFSALSYGATLVLGDSDDPFSHLKVADSAILTPSVAKVLDPNDFPRLKYVYLVGEAVSQAVCNTWANGKVLYNMYGPTEATCGATIKRLKPGQPITLGRPNPTTRIYVLNDDLRLVPQGVEGEVCLAGVQVSQGYIGRAEETLKKFTPDHLSLKPRERMYRTGDRGYWNEDGELCLLGRRDRQIKLRGFRLDLDDIEIRMQRAVPECSRLAVLVKNDCLVAYTSPSAIDIAAFRSKVAQALPPYALPREVIAIDDFPHTRVGKLDYAALRSISAPRANELSSTLTPLQRMITTTWIEVLSLPEDTVIDMYSNFFDLGGNSVSQLRLASRLSKNTGYSVPAHIVVNSPTIESLAEKIEQISIPNTVTSTPVRPSSNEFIARHFEGIEALLGPFNVDIQAIPKLTYIEEEWCEKYMTASNTSSFNVTAAWELRAAVDFQKLIAAWNKVLEVNKIFRSRYQRDSRGSWSKKYHHSPPQVSLSSHFNLRNESNRPFNISSEHLVRVFAAQNSLLLVISHIICDLTSLKTMLRDVCSYYLREIRNHAIQQSQPIRPLSLSREDYTHQLTFWSSNLHSLRPLRYSLGRPAKRSSYSGSSLISKLPAPFFRSMLGFTKKHRVTLHQLALAAVTVALQHDSTEHDILLGAPHLNRSSEDELHSLGLFLEPLPIRIRYPAPITTLMLKSQNLHPTSDDMSIGSSASSFIQAVGAASQASLAHAVPWGTLLSHLNIRATDSFPSHPLFDVMVTFHDERPSSIQNTSKIDLSLTSSSPPVIGSSPDELCPGATPLYTYTEGAKFHLMVEFLTRGEDEELLLRLEYADEGWEDRKEVATVAKCIAKALEALLAERQHEDIVASVRDVAAGCSVEARIEGVPEETANDYFGKRMSEL